jgi:hypothetical protein
MTYKVTESGKFKSKNETPGSAETEWLSTAQREEVRIRPHQ